MADVMGLRMDLERSLERAGRWLGEGSTWLSDDQQALDDDRHRLAALRGRAASALINVAMLGAFSSGKTFLLSGLQGGLELRMVGRGPQYIGLLPSDTRPTTSSPATVEPAVADQAGVSRDYGGRGFLRVRFSDSQGWEDIGPSQSPATIAAYASAQPDPTARRESDWNRQVEEVQILLGKFLLHAKLYDLPGHGSTNPAHEAIVRARMRDADCFLYVANATRTLDEADLGLIRCLYEHHKNTRKRVIWVVTAIDKATEVDHRGNPAWQTTVEANTQFLRDSFRLPDGLADRGFIGNGFMPVSPALEAQGKMEEASGDPIRVVNSRDLIAESGMEDLRNVLRDLIENDTGRRHIAQIASEARTVVQPRQQILADLLAAQRLPYDELRRQESVLQERLGGLDEAMSRAEQEMENMLKRRIRHVERPFAERFFPDGPFSYGPFSYRRGLADHLRTELAQTIDKSDMRKPRIENELEVRRTQLIWDWMTGAKGPTTLWEQEFDGFKAEVLSLLRRAQRDGAPLEDFASVRKLTVDDLIVPRREQSRRQTEDLVKRVAAVTGIVAPAAGGAAAALGIVTGGLALIPVGVTLGAAIIYGVVVRKRESELAALRHEWKKDLDEVARHAEKQFTYTVGALGSDVIERAMDLLAEHRKHLTQSLLAVQNRISAPETFDVEERIAHLEPLCREGAEVLEALVHLSSVAGDLVSPR